METSARGEGEEKEQSIRNAMPARSRHPTAFTAAGPPRPHHFPAVPPRPHGGGGDADHHLGLEPMVLASPSDPSSRRGDNAEWQGREGEDKRCGWSSESD